MIQIPWFKVDDAFHSHPKVVDVDLDAVGLWLVAGTWCANYLTDGLISLRQVRRLGGDREQVDKLVDSGLWVPHSDGWQFKDWDEYQPSKEEVEAERKTAKERMRALRAKRKGTDTGSSGEHDANVRENRDRSSEEVQSPRPSPSQPDPTLSSNEERKPRKRGSRLDPQWTPSRELIEQMREECPSVDLQAQHRQFVDYWIGATGQRATKLDWDGTWRNWMRRKQEDAGNRRPATRPTKDDEWGAFLHGLDDQPKELTV